MLLVAACPSGAIANVYAYLGRANVGLSVTLTAMSCRIRNCPINPLPTGAEHSPSQRHGTHLAPGA